MLNVHEANSEYTIYNEVNEDPLYQMMEQDDHQIN